MKVKDHFLSNEIFEIQDTEFSGIKKTYPIPNNLDKYYESVEYISHHQDKGGLKEKIYKFAQSFNLNYKRNILAKETFINAKILDYGCGAGEFIKYIEDDFETFGYEPNENARNFVVDFSFLPKSKKYEATIYEDGKAADYINNPQSYNIYKKTVTNKTKIPVKLARSGGYAISVKESK